MEAFIQKKEGRFSLYGKEGEYMCQVKAENAVLTSNGEPIGTFTCDPVGWPNPRDLDSTPDTRMAVIGICDSEIIAEIQKPESEGAYFVLPSQLNGAEYPSPTQVVNRIEDYQWDNTGGPRGQLAVHPAAGQFIIDNAACDHRRDGINAVDTLLARNPTFSLKNGYLEMPLPNSDAESHALSTKFLASIDTLRPLLMSGIPASGLTPSKQRYSEATHKVNLVYASAVPLETYNNRPSSQVQKDLHNKIAEGVLVAQYYGALKTAANRAQLGTTATVFLMPLGGGVFNNPFSSIAKSISKAVEMLTDDDRAKLVVRVLTWNGNRNEKLDMISLLNKYNKLEEE